MIDLALSIFNSIPGNIFLIILSFAFLYYGADLLVKGSVKIANSMGVQKLIIGITIVAFGTSMPEFVVSITAGIKKSVGIAIGNVIGSNIANIALILGTASLIRPLNVNMEIIKIEVPVLFAATLVFNIMVFERNCKHFRRCYSFIDIFYLHNKQNVLFNQKKAS